MPKYLCLQRNLPGASTKASPPSPEQMQQMYAQFNAWREKFKPHLSDPGGRLGAGRLITATPAPDAPLVELKELIGGYMIVSAADLDEAIRVAGECPGLVSAGSGVEVIEIRTP